MPIPLTEEHRELAATVGSFLERHDALKAARAALDGGDALPPFWPELAELGWLGLHVAEEHGGSGFGLLETAIVAEALGRACTPGPFLPTVVVAGAVQRAGAPSLQRELLPRLVSGVTIAGLALAEGGPVLCGAMADVIALPSGDDLVVVPNSFEWSARTNLDLTRPCATAAIDVDTVHDERRIRGGAAAARAIFSVLAGAEAAGGIAACTSMAATYARDRIAFGRPIGQFQAVKHKCANMRIDEELAVAVAWDAARSGGRAIEACVTRSIRAFLRVAQRAIQVHGGIGFTWEHDAHLFLRRAAALVAFTGDTDVRVALGAAAPDIAAARPTVDLPAQAERVRAEIRLLRAEHDALPREQRHRHLADNGLLFPNWPPPFGRGADAIEQLVIEEELRGVTRDAALGPNAWTLPIVLPTLLAHGTDDQRTRWVQPTLRGELRWCQLFSEPGAGSDLAALSTKAVRVDGGWLVTGQKVWTSHAQHAHVGLALVRTGVTVPKHRGITCMVVDMASAGVTIRPLRQITGSDEFNEVFLDDVFVADDDVVGEVDAGWGVARTTLGNERVSLGADVTGLAALVAAAHERASTRGPGALAALGDAMATVIAIRAVNLRAVACAVDGVEPDAGGNVTKLVAAELVQVLAGLAHESLGSDGVFADEAATVPSAALLQSPMATIAGGTSEIVRNVIGERLLGLPRDSDPQAR